MGDEVDESSCSKNRTRVQMNDWGCRVLQDAGESEAGGWKRRHTVDVARVQESIDLYQSIGFDVAVRYLTPEDFGVECQACEVKTSCSYVLIYTRRRTSWCPENMSNRQREVANS